MAPERPTLSAEVVADWFTPGRFSLILAALILASFPGVLFGTETFFYRDYGVLGFPFIYFHREETRTLDMSHQIV